MIYSQAAVKLHDCRKHGVESNNEIIIVEGDSAALAVQQVRDMKIQALLPMQGKPMNASKVAIDKIFAYPLYQVLLEAMGFSKPSADTLEVSKIRYQGFILLMDPDADGIHAGALLALFFDRLFPSLIAAGKVAWVRPPVGELVHRETGEALYVQTEAEFQAALKRLGDAANASKYRGLAGMPAHVLARCCVDPATRVLEVVTAAHIAQIKAYLSI